MGRGSLVGSLSIPSELPVDRSLHTPANDRAKIDASSGSPIYPIQTNWCYSSGTKLTLFMAATALSLVTYF